MNDVQTIVTDPDSGCRIQWWALVVDMHGTRTEWLVNDVHTVALEWERRTGLSAAHIDFLSVSAQEA